MLHGFSSCTLRPAIAMMSLIIAGRHRSGCEPAATPASLPSGMASVPAGEGVFYCYSSRSVFPPTAAPELTIIGVIPLLPLARLYEPSQPAARHDARAARRRGRISSVLTKRAQLGFAICAMLFTLGNATMLPLPAVCDGTRGHAIDRCRNCAAAAGCRCAISSVGPAL
jgi:hypothetical protein